MNRIDKNILECLQINGKISNQELANKVALSPSPCLRRVKQLEEQGYIKQYTALLEPEKIGLNLSVFVLVGLSSHCPKLMKNFEDTIVSIPEVVHCYLIAGQTSDYLLKVMIPNLDEYQRFLLKKLTSIDGVSRIHSSFVLQDIKAKAELPLEYL